MTTLALKRLAHTDTLTPFGRRLVWVIACLALAILPHLTHLSPWIVPFTAMIAAMRVVIDVRRQQLPPGWISKLVALAALGAVIVSYRTLNGVEAGTGLLIVMAGMKLLEARTTRDLTILLFASYFAFFSAFLYDQRLALLPYLLGSVWLLTATLMRIHQTSARMPIREAFGLTGKMFLWALPLATLLFLFFPRLPGQFWAMPARSQATSGIPEEMSPGDVSDLSLSGELAFRARFEGELPPPRERYWRGPVLLDFDGRTWRRSNRVLLEQSVTTSGPVYRYRITLEPHQRRWVFGLDMPIEWPRQLQRRFDYQLWKPNRDPISVVTSFDLVSQTAFVVTGDLPLTTRRATLALPAERNPKARELAVRMRAESGSDAAFIEAVLAKFRNEEYFYTLEPPRLQIDSIDDFLFNTRRGFCEHFASAFTALARAADIPARVVMGYQGGEYNSIGGYLIVRQSEAHAWSEVWLEGRGWIRVDPTAAIAPERIEGGGLNAAMGEDEPVPGRLLSNNAPLNQLRLLWDAVDAFWNDQVVDFGETQQRWLLAKLNIDEPGWEVLGTALSVSLAGFFAILSVYLGWRYRPRRRDSLLQVYDQLCRKLARRDLARMRHEGPHDYLTRAALARPDLAGQLSEARALYISLRYGPRPLADQLSRFKFVVNQLRA